MQRYFISPDQVQGEQFVIRGDDVHHIRRVMRFRPGDQLIACDGEGTDYLGELTEEIGNEVICRILRREPSAGEPGLQVTLAQSLPKGDKWEWVLQKGTELGASSFLPFTSRRTVVKWDRVKAEKRRVRWKRILKEAAEQSHRGRIPTVSPVTDWNGLLEAIARAELALIAYEGGGEPLSAALARKSFSRLLLIVGPEGGWEEEEVRQAREAGAVPVSLGSRILRTETAAVAMLACAMFANGEMGGETL
ncbi:16S rRNA (uracil1498-N3)-methyltransferase [Planifilum fulgidum]|jgi:16S rRNA (uracil1498-N3)-methyltransferase|uniref:Ribosomal RNA small subunit methyltransferase E n=1 Tax=Planifilum fulgidum TaxID=201973 RepID=A0A1I2KT07_9BACL|nr:16S rRNA (uracil(1498)-N(3))-methyltransferase [Planifilum fulgidum]MBO2495553.1 16S rRNA (uracil(1498)-N(3))-methyltransferase [Bacillota bacterium]MBO2531457.1 16S rRNA (uracil(1498)-N(3))-methyltransferase [Thermoactinomycetaceae bacterium]SFF68221.1 16S rRNA (uracil1498-N3)-methyltransferase [Planifilum fulgidum]